MAKLPARDTEFDRKKQRKNDSPQQNRGTQEMTHQDLTLPEISTAQTLHSRGVVLWILELTASGGWGVCVCVMFFFAVIF